MEIVKAQEILEIEREAIRSRGITSIDMMERAAHGVLETCMLMLEGKANPRAVVFCGRGNNGGDGIATARLLLEAGVTVRAFLVGSREKMTADCLEMERRLVAVGGKLEDFDVTPAFADWCLGAHVMVDAIYGIGLNTAVKDNAELAVQMMNTCDVPVVSVDIASGVEADTGEVLGMAVEATKTVTFTRPKIGHFLGAGGLHCGGLVVVDVGIPQDMLCDLSSDVQAVCASDIHLPRRARDSYKGDYGKVYILGGSIGYSGAPVFAARSAVRTGSGLVHLGVPNPIWNIVASKLNETMCHPLPAGKEGMISLEATELALSSMDDCDVCLIGPGLGRGNGVASVVRHVLRNVRKPVVLDADGINALQGHIDILDGRIGSFTVITPHDGEFERIGGDLTSQNRLDAARNFAAEHGCVVVLKGHRTISAFPDGKAYINTTGNPGMAKGGSGDVLGGIMISLLGQGLSAREAIPMAVFFHGLAGDLCAQRRGEYGMIPTDIVETLPEIMMQFDTRPMIK